MGRNEASLLGVLAGLSTLLACVPSCAEEPRRTVAQRVEEVSRLRGREYRDAVEKLVDEIGDATRLPAGEELSLEVRVATAAIRQRLSNPEMYQWWTDLLQRYVEHLEAERRQSLRRDFNARTEKEAEDQWRQAGLDPDKFRLPPVISGMSMVGRVSGSRQSRAYLSFLNPEEAIVRRWGASAYPMLLECALFEPYSAVLARKSKDLSARKDYAEFWFRVAVSITPKDKQTSRQLAEVIEHVSTDTDRRGGIRAIAMERLAQVAEEPGQMQPVFGNTVSKENLLRGTALHALGIWAARHASATDKALGEKVKEAIQKLEDAAERDAVPWIKEACRAALEKIAPSEEGERKRNTDASGGPIPGKPQ